MQHSPKTITVWQRQTKNGWEHNHISDGWADELQKPIGHTPQQTSSWAGGKWKKIKAVLNESGQIVYD